MLIVQQINIEISYHIHVLAYVLLHLLHTLIIQVVIVLLYVHLLLLFLQICKQENVY